MDGRWRPDPFCGPKNASRRPNSSFSGRPVSHDVFRSGNVVATALAESLDKPFPWAVGFLYGSTQLGMGLWTVILVVSGLDYYAGGRSN